MSRTRLTLLAVCLSLLSGGCGSSTHSSTTASATTAQGTPTATPTVTHTSKPAAARHRTRPIPAPHPAPSGPPPAPAGLRATIGYATYELCSGPCSGAVPASLRRPLRAPASCAPHGGSGPVAPTPVTSLSVNDFIGSSWKAGRVSWSASGGYGGPLLIRGRQVGSAGAVGFGEGHVPYDELQLLAGAGGHSWQSFTRVQSAGCYFYQVDGTSFSETIVFRTQ